MDRRTFAFSAATTLGLAACRGDSAFALIGTYLPDVTATLTSGEVIKINKIRTPAILRFWGLWCGPCSVDQPYWEQFVRAMRSGPDARPNLNILTVHVGEAPANGPSLEEWTKNQPDDSATFVIDDRDRIVTKAMAIPGTPSTLIVREDGEIVEHSWQFHNGRGVATFVKKVHSLLDPR